MGTWLKDEKTGIECGINEDGDLFLGDDRSGYNLDDTKENREYVIIDFSRYTGRQIFTAKGEPICGGRLEFMSDAEKAVHEFLEECEGKREPAKADNPVTKIEFLSHGDLVHYKDGSTYYRSIED